MNQASFFCPHCQQQRLFQSTPINHTPHILAVVFLCGLWLPFWILISLSHQDVWRCAFCGHSDAVKYLVNPHLRESERIAAEQKWVNDQRRQEERQRQLAEMPMETGGQKLAYLWAAYTVPILVVGGAAIFFGFFIVLALTNSRSASPTNTNPSPQTANRSIDTTLSTQSKTPSPSPTPNILSKTPLPKRSQVATVISENANLRVSPDALGEVLEIVPYGETVEVVRQRGPWFEVRYAENRGWMHGNTIQLSDKP